MRTGRIFAAAMCAVAMTACQTKEAETDLGLPCEPGSECDSGPCMADDSGAWLCVAACPLDKTIVTTLPERSSLDFLAIIDDSPDMAGLTEQVAKTLSSLAQIHDRFSPHIRVGVTTMSVAGSHEIAEGTDCRTGRQIVDGQSYPDGALVHAPGNPALVDLDEIDAETAADMILANAMVGVCGSPQPQGLLAMKLAIERHAASLEPGTDMEVALITGADDHSPGEVADYASWLQSLPFSVYLTGALGAWAGGEPCVATACDPDCEIAGEPCACAATASGDRCHELASLLRHRLKPSGAKTPAHKPHASPPHPTTG